MEGYRKLLRSKIHRARVTHADVHYEGSISISPELLEAAGLLEYEAVNIWNVTNGQRFETYTIRGEPGTKDISINGAAARLVTPGDIIIIACFELVPESRAQSHVPRLVFVDEQNRQLPTRKEIPGPRLAYV
jgi:aspartate 1-decarboxylase